MTTPVVSVVIPVYGVEHYIENCLRSLFAQTFRAFEIILVDDESPDASVAIAQALLEAQALPFQILHQKNQGQGAARDNGIRHAAGKYVICVDSDDTVSPIFLEKLCGEAEKSGSRVCFCLFQMTDENSVFQFSDQRAGFQPISRPEMLHRFLCRTLIPILPAMLMRRELLLEKGITAMPGCRFTEDIYYMWLVFSAAEIVSYTTMPLYNYLLRENSTMTASSKERILSGYQALCGLSGDPRFQVDFPGRAYVLPRWVLGALNSTARICTYSDFMDVAKQMDYAAQMRRMKGFPERKGRILALLLRYLPGFYYEIVRRK